MQLKYFKKLVFIFTIALLSACTSSTTTVVVTSNANFVSMSLVNSKIANLSKAVFTLIGDTIVNLDSLPAGTKVERIIPVFSFKSSDRAILIKSTGDSIAYSGKDSIDFTSTTLCKIRNYASDQKTPKLYSIKVNVHKVDPEFYNWTKISDQLKIQDLVSQKAILLNDQFFYFMRNSSASYLQTSADGVNWTGQLSVTGLPSNPHFENMTVFNGKLYLALNDNKLYSTTDGQVWVAEYPTLKYKYSSLLCSLNGNLRLVVQANSDGKFHLGSIKAADNDTLLVYADTLVKNFPVSDFAALSFVNRMGISKAIVLGGKDVRGDTLKSNWNTEDGIIWVNFSRDSPSLNKYSIWGSSVISYDNQLLLFGAGVNVKAKAEYLVSKDEGYTWNLPDSLRNYLPNDTLKNLYRSRTHHSVLVHKPMTFKGINSYKKEEIALFNNIFIIGGKSGSTYYPEIWKGKLNRLNFNRQ